MKSHANTHSAAPRGTSRIALVAMIAALLLTAALAPAQMYVNRAPHAPTLIGPLDTWEQVVALEATFGGMVRLDWQTQGDPEGDPVQSWVQVMRWNPQTQQWLAVVNNMISSTHPRCAYGLKFSAGDLLPGTWYMWRILAVDTSYRSNPWCTATPWRRFVTAVQGTTGGGNGGGGGIAGNGVETIVVRADTKTKVTSRTVLQSGRTYVIEASGTFSCWSKATEGVDAVYNYQHGKEVWNQLRIDGKGLTDIAGPIPYNAQHVYRITYAGQGKALEMWLHDAQCSPSDNGGAITVKITPQ